MQTNQSHETQACKGFNARSFFRSASYLLLPVLSQLIELSFPGMLNGIVLTPEMVSMFIRSILHSTH